MRPYYPLLTSTLLLLSAGAGAALAQTPVIMPGGVLNAASSDQTGLPLALGSMIAIYGSNLAPQTDVASTIPYPSTIDGVTVTVNNVLAPLQVVSSGQINAQIPWEALAVNPPVTNMSATVVVSTKLGGSSAPASITIGPAGPGIFTFGFGPGQAIAYNYSDATFASSGPIANFPSLPYRAVKINDLLVVYATGLGAVSPPVATGAGATGVSSTLITPTVLVGGVAANVPFSGLSPYPGVYQLNVVLAAGTPTGAAVPLQIQMGGVTSRADVTIAVSQ